MRIAAAERKINLKDVLLDSKDQQIKEHDLCINRDKLGQQGRGQAFNKMLIWLRTQDLKTNIVNKKHFLFIKNAKYKKYTESGKIHLHSIADL